MKISKDFAYFIGAVQSDGYFYKFFNKKRNILVPKIKFCVGAGSIEMLKRVQQIFKNEFGRDIVIYRYDRFNDSFRLETSVKNLLPLFNHLGLSFNDPPTPPDCVVGDTELFGAYLAGVVDGDGNICVKRPKHPQCRIRITSGKPQKELVDAIQKKFCCYVGVYKQTTKGVYKGREIRGTGYNLEFYVSSKNKDKIPQSFFEYITIRKKHDTLIHFLNHNL
jgi:hypothetical protein